MYPFAYHYYLHTRFIMCLECMFKGVWWWDLNKDNKLVANLHAKKPSSNITRFSFHWVILTQDPKLALACWPKSRPLSIEDVFESRELCSMSVSCPSCGLLAKVKTTSCPSTLITRLSMVNGSRLTGITKFVEPKPRLSWFRGKRLGNILDILAYIRYMFRTWMSTYWI